MVAVVYVIRPFLQYIIFHVGFVFQMMLSGYLLIIVLVSHFQHFSLPVRWVQINSNDIDGF